MTSIGTDVAIIGIVGAAVVATYFYTKGLNTPVPDQAPRKPAEIPRDWENNPFGNYIPEADGVSPTIVFAPVFSDVPPTDTVLYRVTDTPLVAPNGGYFTGNNSSCMGGCDNVLSSLGGFVNAMNQVTRATLAAIRAIADRPLPVPVNINVASKPQVFYRPRDVPVVEYDTAARFGQTY